MYKNKQIKCILYWKVVTDVRKIKQRISCSPSWVVPSSSAKCRSGHEEVCLFLKTTWCFKESQVFHRIYSTVVLRIFSMLRKNRLWLALLINSKLNFILYLLKEFRRLFLALCNFGYKEWLYSIERNGSSMISEQRMVLQTEYFSLWETYFIAFIFLIVLWMGKNFIMDGHQFSDLQLKLSNWREGLSVSIWKNTWDLGVWVISWPKVSDSGCIISFFPGVLENRIKSGNICNGWAQSHAQNKGRNKC